MSTVSATELKNRLGRYLEAAITEPVIVEKSGRVTSVVLSKARYDELLAAENSLLNRPPKSENDTRPPSLS